MNVREFTGEEQNTNQKAVWLVMGPISAAIILGLALGAYIDYGHTERKQERRRAMDNDESEGGRRQNSPKADVEKGTGIL